LLAEHLLFTSRYSISIYFNEHEPVRLPTRPIKLSKWRNKVVSNTSHTIWRVCTLHFSIAIRTCLAYCRNRNFQHTQRALNNFKDLSLTPTQSPCSNIPNRPMSQASRNHPSTTRTLTPRNTSNSSNMLSSPSSNTAARLLHSTPRAHICSRRQLAATSSLSLACPLSSPAAPCIRTRHRLRA
jgi:hypothetical protein